MKQGSPEEAMRHQRAAIDLRKGLAEEFPKQLSYRIDLALSLSNLGAILSSSGKERRGLRFGPRGQRDPAEPWSRNTPKTRSLQSTLALSTLGMAVILNTLGRWKESRPLYVESVEIMEPDRRRESSRHRVPERCWRASPLELGQYLIDHDEIEAGLNALAKARDQAETVRTDEPE